RYLPTERPSITSSTVRESSSRRVSSRRFHAASILVVRSFVIINLTCARIDLQKAPSALRWSQRFVHRQEGNQNIATLRMPLQAMNINQRQLGNFVIVVCFVGLLC